MRELVSYRIEIDNSQATAALRESERQIQRTDDLLRKMGVSADEAAAMQRKAALLTNESLEKVAKGTSTLEQEVRKVGQTTKTQAGVMDSALASVGRRILAVFAVERIIAFGTQVVNTAGKIQDLSDRTGLSTTAIQKFGYAADLSGSNIDAMANAINTMSKNLIGGNGGAVAALNQLGLSQQALMRMEPEQAFLAITSAIKGMKDPMQQADATMKIFGRSGTQILPAIKAGFAEAGDEAERLGAIMSEQTVKDLDDLGDAWTKVWAVLESRTARVLAVTLQLVTSLKQLGTAAPDWLKTGAGWVGGLIDTPFRLTGNMMGQWQSQMAGWNWRNGQTPAPQGTPGALGAGGTWSPGGLDDLLNVTVPEPVIESNRRLASSRREVQRATEDATAATLAFLRAQTVQIGVNRQLENPAYAQYGVVGLMPGFGAVPGVPGQVGGVGLPADAAARGAYMGWGNPGFGTMPAGASGRGWGNGWSSNAGLAATGALGAMDFTEQAAGFWQATDVAGRGNRAWAGAKRGAAIGSMFGPWGTLIGMGVGALVGALRNPGFEQEMKRISRNFGINISEELARSIDKLRKSFGGDRAAAEIFALDAIVKEAGGVNDQNVSRLTARLRDVFVMVETGKFSTEQATQVLDRSFGAFAEHLEKSGKLASRQFLELLELNARFGTESSAIAEFVRGQVESAAGGLDQYLQNAFVTTQGAADGVTSAIVVMFGTLRQQGVPVKEVLELLGKSIDLVKNDLINAGLAGSEAFNTIAELATFAADEGVQKATSAVDGLSQLMRGLHNGAMLNGDTFKGLSRAVYDVYRNLELQGKGGEQAWRMMQPGLQTVWELQQKFGWEVDEVTQNLIDQAKAAGLIGDQFKPAGELMKDLLTDIKAILGDIRDAFLNVGDAAQQAGQQAADAFDGALPGGGSNGDGTYYSRGGVVYAAKGWPQPRGTDTIPAMLTPGEGVLSRAGMAALGALNSGRGLGGRAVTVQVNLNGAVLTDQRAARMLAQTVADEFRRELGRQGVRF